MRIRTIDIIGGGTSGAFTVHYLCAKLPKVQVRWIYPEHNNPIGVGEGTTPSVISFLDKIDVTPADIISKCGGSLKVGVKFKHWKHSGHSYFHPFGDDRAMQSLVTLMHSTNKIPSDVMNYDTALHFSALGIVEYLTNNAHKFTNLTVIRDTATYSDCTADLIVDCTGFKRLIMKGAVDDNFITFEDKIPNNCATIYRSKYTNRDVQLVPYTTSTAMDYGWLWTIPLRHSVGFGYVHNTNHDVYSEFVNYVEQYLGAPINTNHVNNVSFAAGRYDTHLVQNKDQSVACVGLSSAFIEPLEATGLHLTVTAIQLLYDYIIGKISIERYNNTINTDFDNIAHFIIAHYKYTDRDSEYWQPLKKLYVDNFKPNTVFPKINWEQILGGLGVYDRPVVSPSSLNISKLLSSPKYIDWIDHEKYAR